MNAAPNIFSPKPIPVLDEELFFDDELEAGVLASIQRCGAVDLHPDVWGAHDGFGVYSDGFPEDRWTPEAKQRQKDRDLAQKERARLAAEAAARQRDERDRKRRRLELHLRIEKSQNLRPCLARFILDQEKNEFHRDPFTRQRLREAIVPILMRMTKCDRIAAVCAANEFMDFGLSIVERSLDTSTPITVSGWLVSRIRGYLY